MILNEKMTKIAASPICIVISLVVCFLLLALSVAFMLTGKFLISFILIAACLTLFVLFVLLYRDHQNIQSDELGKIVFDHIVKKGVKTLDLNSFQVEYGVSQKHVIESARKAYKHCLLLAMKDFKVTENERKLLEIIANKLDISQQEAQRLEKSMAKDIYCNEMKKSLRDGRLTENESNNLLRIRSHLGLSLKEAYDGSKKEVIEGYKKLFNRFAVEGILSVDECEELQIYSKTTGLEPAHAAMLAPGECENLYKRTVVMICQDGVVTDDELLILDRLEELLKIPDSIKRSCHSMVWKTQEMEKIRKGKLPILTNHLLQLNPSELCHLDNPCEFIYQTPTQRKYANGRLVVTDRRLLFLSDTRNFETGLRRIVNITRYSNGVSVECTSNRGKGFYKVCDPDKLDAILDALTKRINFVISENSDSAQTRHIPHHIKTSVWQRDGGQCVKCGANDYLEYDHIIPFSRGGANTFNNVQILCRRCNLSKGAEIV